MKTACLSVVTNISATLIVVFRNYLKLITSPYKAMRRIAGTKDMWEVYLIFAAVYGYFVFAQIVRQQSLDPFTISSSSLVSFGFFLITFVLITGFFYRLAMRFGHASRYKSYVFTFAYSLLPTLIWFFATSVLFLLFPPPRTQSFLGLSFSLMFIIFSVILLLWRILLLYLSLRFSSRASFYTLIFMLILFAVWFLPYSVLMYALQVFRVPFI